MCVINLQCQDFPRAIVVTIIGPDSKCFYLLQEEVVIKNGLRFIHLEDYSQAAKYIKTLVLSVLNAHINHIININIILQLYIVHL